MSGLIALTVTGCGGGGGGNNVQQSNPANETVSGYFAGKTSQNNFIDIIVKKNGEFWSTYSNGGFVQGNLSVTGDKFISTNAKDFFMAGASVSDATVTGTVKTSTSLKGKLSYSATNSIDFDASYEKDLKVYSLSQLAGTYKGDSAIIQGTEQATVTIDTNGNVTGTGTSGCKINGSIKIPSDGSQYYYDVQLKFGGAPCYMENQTLQGIGFYDGGALSVQAINTARSNGINFSGWKQVNPS